MKGSRPLRIDPERYVRDFPSLRFAVPEPGVLEIVLGNEARLNAASESMHRDLAGVWRALDLDESVRAVLVRGAGAHFSAGGDFAMIEHMLEDEATLLRVLQEARDLVYNIIGCSKPVVSAIRGYAVGAGLAVALLADVSVAAENARLLDGHTRLGVAAGDHAVIIWPLLCGLAKARYHLLLNEPVSGKEAERIGLVSLCVPDAEVEPKALAIARSLCAGSATAIRFTKQSLNNWLKAAGPSFDQSLALEFLGFRLSDAREGLRAAREKRAARFEGPPSAEESNENH
jgi:enoyl-CoA hydratase